MKIGFFGLLQLVFIVLKVIGQIDWSWWLVFIPFYIWFVIVVFVITVWEPFMDEYDPMWRFRK